jgi:tol-pal system protein YbgF
MSARVCIVASAVSAVLPVSLAAAACLLASGCARSAEERHLDEMRSTIDEVQADRDEKERDMMAASLSENRLSGAPTPVPAPSSAPLQSVPIGGEPGESGESPDTEDPAPRPTIRVVGMPRVGRNGWREDQVEQSNFESGAGGPGAPAGEARPSALDPGAKRTYDAALALVTARQYDRALDELAAFLVRYPDHPYADNAMYWRGECYFAKGDYLHAAEQFEGTVTRFPAGNKAPDAMLKLGMSHQKLGNPTKAKEIFDRLRQTYPQSDAARHIPTVYTPSVLPHGAGPEEHR